jgi:hypothetical protein
MALKEVDTAREERDLRERFAGAAARVRAEGVRRLARAWRPDVIVSDEVDFGTVLAAEMLEVPYATVLVIAAGSLVRPNVVADTLDTVRSEYGLLPTLISPPPVAIWFYPHFRRGCATLPSRCLPQPMCFAGWRGDASTLARVRGRTTLAVHPASTSPWEPSSTWSPVTCSRAC